MQVCAEEKCIYDVARRLISAAARVFRDSGNWHRKPARAGSNSAPWGNASVPREALAPEMGSRMPAALALDSGEGLN